MISHQSLTEIWKQLLKQYNQFVTALHLPERPVLAAAVMLGLFTAIATGSVGLMHFITEARIARNEQNTLLHMITQLVPEERFDNDLLSDVIQLSDPALGSHTAQPVYRGRLQGEPQLAVFSPIAPDGYNGRIRLLVAVHADGTLAGVNVLDHKETPGLGDPIDAEKSGWIHQFSGLSLENPAEHRWRVKKDGGQFDQFTGATITPRAVVKAIRQTLQYFKAHRAEVFAPVMPRKSDVQE